MQRTQNYNLVKIDLTDSPPDITVLNPNFDTIDSTLINKVDKAEGKQLSTEDYTTVEKNKLSGIADNANNYVHPESHPAAMITEDETHRFFTDVERSKLNGIAEGANNYVHPPTHTASEISEEENKRFLTDGERSKLSGIQDGANNYVHPEKHPANIIEEEANRRFFTDNERAKLAGIQEGANKYTHPSSHPATFIVFNGNKTLQSFIDNGGTFGGTVIFLKNIDLRGALQVPRISGSGENVYFGNSDKGTRIEVTGGLMRLYTSWGGGNADCGISISPDGSTVIRSNNTVKHSFNANGTKTGGTMEIDGTVYGMSPTDSPQTLIEYIEYDINVEGEKVIKLDHIYKKMISKYAVFSSNPDIKIVEKTSDYFKVQGNGIADFVIKGQRKGADEYFRIMGGLEHGVTEEQTN